MHTIFGDLDYVQGYLRIGHLEMELMIKILRNLNLCL